MRTAAAFTMVLVLLGAVTFCSLIACPLAAAANDSCCHKPQSSSGPPCHSKAVQDCPYLVLENGKTTPIVTYAVAAHIQPVTPEFALQDSHSIVRAEFRLTDSAGLFLRNCVLLI
jgi:hypothetical protein